VQRLLPVLALTAAAALSGGVFQFIAFKIEVLGW
jgi:hypothetical protein